MVRKCRGINNAELAVVLDVAHVGVITRARALSMANSPKATSQITKRRKAGGRNRVELNSSTNSTCIQLKSSSRRRDTPNSSISLPELENFDNYRSSSPRSEVNISVSCCSSNGSSEVVKKEEDVEEVDNTSIYVQRKEEITSSSEEGVDESSAGKPRTPEVNSRWRSSTLEKAKMPTEIELEEFFSAAEKYHLEFFKKKYNFDFEKEESLEGRYDWIQLKPEDKI